MEDWVVAATAAASFRFGSKVEDTGRCEGGTCFGNPVSGSFRRESTGSVTQPTQENTPSTKPTSPMRRRCQNVHFADPCMVRLIFPYPLPFRYSFDAAPLDGSRSHTMPGQYLQAEKPSLRPVVRDTAGSGVMTVAQVGL